MCEINLPLLYGDTSMRLSFDQIKHSSDMLISAPGVVGLFLFAWSYISAAEWALKPADGGAKKLCTHQQSIQRAVFAHKEDVARL